MDTLPCIISSETTERRRPGRVEYENPALIALLRGGSAATACDNLAASEFESPVWLAGAGRMRRSTAWLPRIAKRALDIVAGVLMRIGASGQVFECLKFRSMIANADAVLADLLARSPEAKAEWDATQKLRKDPRITPVGRLLRKTSLDELPQLINVVLGDMSLVGPRPIVASEVRFYGDKIAYYQAVRPGVTGLWQVSGRSDTTYDRRVQLDVWYVRNRSLWLDIAILFRTLPAVLSRRGAI